MAFVELEAGDAQEAQSVPEDTYQVEVISFVPAVSRKARESGWNLDTQGPTMYEATIAINSDEHPNARTCREYFSLPLPGDEKKAKDFKTLNLVRFFQCFGINYTLDGGNISFDDEDPVGATGECLVTLDPPNDSGERYNSLRLPRSKDLSAEGSDAKGGRRRRA